MSASLSEFKQRWGKKAHEEMDSLLNNDDHHDQMPDNPRSPGDDFSDNLHHGDDGESTLPTATIKIEKTSTSTTSSGGSGRSTWLDGFLLPPPLLLLLLLLLLVHSTWLWLMSYDLLMVVMVVVSYDR